MKTEEWIAFMYKQSCRYPIDLQKFNDFFYQQYIIPFIKQYLCPGVQDSKIGHALWVGWMAEFPANLRNIKKPWLSVVIYSIMVPSRTSWPAIFPFGFGAALLSDSELCKGLYKPHRASLKKCFPPSKKFTHLHVYLSTIIKDPNYPGHSLFSLLFSDR